VLNDAPDLSEFPLYDQPQHTTAQIRFLGERYRDETAILAWDIRESGDRDYLNGAFERTTILKWLADTALLIHEAAPNHLVTANWSEEPSATIGAVDFVSIKFNGDLNKLRQQIAVVVEKTQNPIIVSSVGYSTFGSSEEGQRDSLQKTLDAVKNNRLAGWLVWTAFDFPLTATCYKPDCVNTDSADHHYGLWTTDYESKLAVDVIRFASNGQ
jgi:hypothetical protein